MVVVVSLLLYNDDTHYDTYNTFYIRNISITLKSGLLSSLPFVCNWICIQIAGFFAAYFTEKKLLSTTVIRRSFHLVACIFPSICLLLKRVLIFSIRFKCHPFSEKSDWKIYGKIEPFI